MPGEIRTPDLQLRRLTLYPTELRAQIKKNITQFIVAQSDKNLKSLLYFNSVKDTTVSYGHRLRKISHNLL